MSEQATSPAGSAVDELRPGEAHDNQRHVLDVNRQVLDEIQKAGVRPVQVLDDDEQRLARSKTLEQSACGEEKVIAVAGRFVDAQTGEEGDVASRLFNLRRRQHLLDCS